MTRGKFFFLVLLFASFLFAVFIWPTRYKQIQEGNPYDESIRPMRADRLTDRIEIQKTDGEWVEYAPPPPDFDPMTDTDAGRGLTKTQQAGDDIRKMNEVTQDAMNNGTLGK